MSHVCVLENKVSTGQSTTHTLGHTCSSGLLSGALRTPHAASETGAHATAPVHYPPTYAYGTLAPTNGVRTTVNDRGLPQDRTQSQRDRNIMYVFCFVFVFASSQTY